MRRREFLTLSVASIGGVLVYSLDRKVSRLAAQTTKAIRIPLRFLSEEEALIVAAATSRIFPSDETGPGAQEAGVAVYIDRQLAGPWGRDRYRYTQEPFEESAPAEFGYQGKATPQHIYRLGLKGLKGLRSPCTRGARPEAEADRNHFVFLFAAPEHYRGHVLRSDARREHRHDGLATNRVSRSAPEQLWRCRQALR